MNRDHFIYQLLKYSSSAEKPDDCIQKILEQIGNSFQVDRAYLFEMDEEGNFDNTYEWHAFGVSPFEQLLSKLSYEEVLGTWFKKFFHEEFAFIENIEACRTISEDVYQTLKSQKVERFLIWPILLNESFIGFFGVDNPSPIYIEEMKEAFRSIGYFLSIMIRYRDSMNRLERIGYEDPLTGVMNRHALEVFDQEIFNTVKTIGVLSCDINGLKGTNDSLGHGEGDHLIMDVAESLSVVFDKKNVYRIGGDEFLVLYSNGPEKLFEKKIEQAKKLMAHKGVNIASGSVFQEHTEKTISQLMKEVDLKMYADKAKFYSDGKNERRNRREKKE